MSWQFDSVAGVYRNHALSQKIRMQAAADSMFSNFVDPEPNYGKRKGASITVTRILQMPLAARVGENDRLPAGRPVVDTKAVSPSEWGQVIEMTEFEENLTFFDLRNKFQRMLKDQMTLTMDGCIQAALRGSVVKYTPHETAGADDSAFDTDGTPSVTANININISHLRQIHDFLKGTQKTPYFRGGRYIGILTTKAARGIKNDAEYKDWQAPTTSQPFLDGMIKNIEGFDLYECNNFHAAAVTWANQATGNPSGLLCNAVGTGGVLGEALFFGADAGFLAMVADPELRAEIPQNLGRFRAFGWVGTFEAGTTWDSAATQRIVHVASA